MLLNLKYPKKKKHTHQKRRFVDFQFALRPCLCWMFEAGKFEVLIPVGIPGEGMLGSRWKYQRCQKQLYTREIFTWNLKMMVSKRNLLFQGLLFRFHIKFQGCTPRKFSHGTQGCEGLVQMMFLFKPGDVQVPCEFSRVYVSEFFLAKIGSE